MAGVAVSWSIIPSQKVEIRFMVKAWEGGNQWCFSLFFCLSPFLSKYQLEKKSLKN